MSSREYEDCAVGALLQDNRTLDTMRLVAEDFTTYPARAVWAAAAKLIERGGTADEVSVLHELNGEKVPLSYLGRLPPAAGNCEWYADKIKQASKRRRLKTLAQELLTGVDDTSVGVDELIECADRGITSLGDVNRRQLVWLMDVLKPAVEDIERRSKNGGAITGVASGYGPLDRMTDGFQSGDLIIVAARTSIGKTALAISLLVNIAVVGHTLCGMFSAEMGELMIGQRFLANHGKFSLGDVRSGCIGRRDMGGLLKAANDLYSKQIMLDATPNIKLMDLKAGARAMVRQGIKLIVVDYLTLVRHGDPRTPRHERVGEVSKELKGLARELDVPIIALSQVNRMGEGREPTLAELRQSGEIEEDADLVFLLHRERGAGDELTIPTSLIVAKNRNGPCGTVKLVFIMKSGRFELEQI